MIKRRLLINTFTFLLILITCSSFRGCKKKIEGILEIYDYENGLLRFRAVLFEDQESFPEETEFTIKSQPNSSSKVKGYYWPNKSAKDLGYTKFNSDKTYFVSPDGEEKPGKNGHWKDLLNKPTNNGGGSGSGGTGSGQCSGSYDGPTGDVQLDSYCQYAYAKRCLDGKPLSDPEVQAACATYNDMREPGTPDCPYCK